MKPRIFEDRTVCHKWAAKQRPDKADRIVRPCELCPPSRRSRRRPLRWARVAADVAEALGADPALVRLALKEAVERDQSEAA